MHIKRNRYFYTIGLFILFLINQIQTIFFYNYFLYKKYIEQQYKDVCRFGINNSAIETQ